MIPASVLIVEDTPKTMAWLRTVVADAFPGAAVHTATDLASALVEVGKGDFDFALVDLGLPDGSGLDVIRRIRTDIGAEPYVVVATIFDDDKHLMAALREGANGYLLKDEPHDTMVEHLRGVTQRRPPMSARSLTAVIDNLNQPATGSDDVQLTSREEDVLRLIAKGFNVTESAEMLGLARNTVKGYVKTIYAKLGVTSRAEATAEALKRRLIDL